MQVHEAIDQMLETSHSSMAGVSKAMGRSRNFLFVTLDKGSMPQVDTLVKIAEAMGFKLILEGHGVKIEVDPPPEK